MPISGRQSASRHTSVCIQIERTAFSSVSPSLSLSRDYTVDQHNIYGIRVIQHIFPNRTSHYITFFLSMNTYTRAFTKLSLLSNLSRLNHVANRSAVVEWLIRAIEWTFAWRLTYMQYMHFILDEILERPESEARESKSN